MLISFLGLSVDNVQSFTLVLPNGTVSEITSAQTDLFFALKGGLNRFGIVTQITFKTVPQVPQVYVSFTITEYQSRDQSTRCASICITVCSHHLIQGGYQTFAATAIPALIAATANFSATNTDPKAQVILTLESIAGIPLPVLLTFYDGPTPGPSLAPFSQIPALNSDISTRSFTSLVQSSPTELSGNVERGAFHTLSVTLFTPTFLAAVLNQTNYYSKIALSHSGAYVSYDIEPFLKGWGAKATDSAYPHSESPLPLFLFFTWALPSEDSYWQTQMAASVELLIGVAKQEGIYNPASTAYPNYALASFTGDRLYGPKNAARLRAIQKGVDPDGIMYQSGGFQL